MKTKLLNLYYRLTFRSEERICIEGTVYKAIHKLTKEQEVEKALHGRCVLCVARHSLALCLKLPCKSYSRKDKQTIVWGKI